MATQGARVWEIFKEVVDVLYATEPDARLGLVRPILVDEFPFLTGPYLEKIENTALRMVAWMCEVDSYEKNGFTKGRTK